VLVVVKVLAKVTVFDHDDLLHLCLAYFLKGEKLVTQNQKHGGIFHWLLPVADLESLG
jgi:hypothetical protein